MRTFLTIPMCNTEIESGLLSFQFHPDFKNNGYVFAVYTRNDGMHSTRVARFKSSDGGKTVDPASELKLWEHVQRRGTHHGGDMKFGPDGYLYVSFGDDNSGDYMDARFADAQNPKVSYGKLFRLDVTSPPDAGKPYKIPADNPYAATPAMGLPEVFARGFRNPWRFSFDRGGTHELWLGDPGEETNGNLGDDGKATPHERINKVVKGKFYGWPFWQGTLCYRTCTEKGSCPSTSSSTTMVPRPSSAVTSIAATALPGLVGKYIYGNYSAYRADLHLRPGDEDADRHGRRRQAGRVRRGPRRRDLRLPRGRHHREAAAQRDQRHGRLPGDALPDGLCDAHATRRSRSPA